MRHKCSVCSLGLSSLCWSRGLIFHIMSSIQAELDLYVAWDMQVCLFMNGHVTIRSQLCLEITGCLWPHVKQASEGSDVDLLPRIPYPVESSVVCVGDDMQSLHTACRTTSADHVDSFLLFHWTNGKRLQADLVNWKHVCVIYANFR